MADDCRGKIRMKKMHQDKKYKRNTLKKRIARVMRFSNTISMILLMVAMTVVIGFLVQFLGKGFTMYTAEQIAVDLQESYISMDGDKHDFFESILMDKESVTMTQSDLEDMYVNMTEEEKAGLHDAWNEFVEFQGIQKMDEDKEVGIDVTYFEYRISYGHKIIYDSFEEGRKVTAIDQMNNDNMMAKKVFTESAEPYYDGMGNLLGYVYVRVSPDIISMVVIVAVFLSICVFFANLIISKIITAVTSKMVSRPMETLAYQMEDMANDELEDAFNTVIDIRRPVSEVKSLTESTNKIMQKMAHYYELMTAQNEELEAQRDELESQRDELEAQNIEMEAQQEELEAQKDELESQNDELTRTGNTLQSMNNAYLSRTMKLQNLLDNMGQGFMTFGSDLKVNSEYSLTCTSLLCETDCPDSEMTEDQNNQDITGMKVTDLLFKDDEQKAFIEELLVKVLEGSEHERSLFIPLLPEEILMNGRTQKVEYKIVKNEQFKEHMLVILTDITQTRELEAQMAVERDVLQMIVKVLLNRDEFVSLLEEFDAFLDSEIGSLTQEDYEEVLRSLHTFKGSFAQYYMNHTSDHLNELEEAIYSDGTINSIKAVDTDLVKSRVQMDLTTVEGYVGKDFIFNKDLYTVKEEKIIEIEQKIKNILPAAEFNKVIPIIQSIRYRSVKEGLKSYPDYVTKLSERMNKSVLPFEITGDDVFVDFDVYQKVFKSIVHLFRNAVDHGVEDGDTRIEAGKHISSVIACEVVALGDRFEIIVSDDGRGMNEEVAGKVFEDGYTTKEEATAISGRGVGLPALKEAVVELGGGITVNSKVGEGSTFIINLPLLQGTDIVHFEPDHFVGHIEKVARNYLNSFEFGLTTGLTEHLDQIMLQRVSALINIKGSIDGMLIVSVNEPFANKLVNAFIYDEVSEDEIVEYTESVLGEVTNTILGNVLGDLEDEGVYLNIGVPVMLSNKSAYVKYSDRQIYSVLYEKEDKVIRLSLLITESDHQAGEFMLDDVIIAPEEMWENGGVQNG